MDRPAPRPSMNLSRAMPGRWVPGLLLLLLAGTGIPRLTADIVMGNTGISGDIAAVSGTDAHTFSYANDGEFLAVAVTAASFANGVNGGLLPTVSYNGAPLTQIATAQKGNDEWSGVYYLKDPGVGSFDLTVDFGASKIQENTGFWAFGALSLSGVNETTPLAGFLGANNAGGWTITSQSPNLITPGDFFLAAIATDGVPGEPNGSVLTGSQTSLYYQEIPVDTPTRSYNVIYTSVAAGDLINTDQLQVNRRGGDLKAFSGVVFNAAIPEPSSFALLLISGLAVWAARQRRPA